MQLGILPMNLLLCTVPINSSSLLLEFGDNPVPGSNEIITLERFDLCYRVASSNGTNPLNMDYRTLTLAFHPQLYIYDHPPHVVVYATSFENSVGAESKRFYHGKHVVADIVLNHHTSMSFKMTRRELLKEKHTDCMEVTFWDEIEKLFYPKVVENCTNPCYPRPLPGGRLSFCQLDDGDDGMTDGFNGQNITGFGDEDRDCAYDVYVLVLKEAGDFYNFKSCIIEEYEARVLQDNEIIPGTEEFYYWSESDKLDRLVAFPFNDYEENPGNISVKFSYTFDSPQALTIAMENYIVTFFDLIGIVGGTLGLFIGFAWYDNVLAAGEYLIMMFNWIIDKRKASKVSNVKKKFSKEEHPKQETAKLEMPKLEIPKQETGKLEMPKQKMPKQEASKQEASKQENPKQQTQVKDEEITKVQKNISILQKPLKTENSVGTNPKAKTMSQNQHSHRKESTIVDIEHITKS